MALSCRWGEYGIVGMATKESDAENKASEIDATLRNAHVSVAVFRAWQEGLIGCQLISLVLLEAISHATIATNTKGDLPLAKEKHIEAAKAYERAGSLCREALANHAIAYGDEFLTGTQILNGDGLVGCCYQLAALHFYQGEDIGNGVRCKRLEAVAYGSAINSEAPSIGLARFDPEEFMTRIENSSDYFDRILKIASDLQDADLFASTAKKVVIYYSEYKKDISLLEQDDGTVAAMGKIAEIVTILGENINQISKIMRPGPNGGTQADFWASLKRLDTTEVPSDRHIEIPSRRPDEDDIE